MLHIHLKKPLSKKILNCGKKKKKTDLESSHTSKNNINNLLKMFYIEINVAEAILKKLSVWNSRPMVYTPRGEGGIFFYFFKLEVYPIKNW